MTRRNGHRYGRNGNGNGEGHGFNLATVAQIFAIPLLTAGGLFFAQWVTTGDTLRRHEQAISTTIPDEFKEEAQAREKASNEFIDKLTKLSDSVNQLSTNVAVQGEQNKQIAQSLEKISNQLGSVSRR